MIAAFRDSYVEVVFYQGINERYPDWFLEEIYEKTLTDASNYTFYIEDWERSPDYHEKQLVEDYSVFLRKPDGRVHLTNYDIFEELYHIFRYDRFDNSGLAALKTDTIEYVECHPGSPTSGYPDWLYEYFSESIVWAQGEESIFIDADDGTISVTQHTVFMRNKFGEIRSTDYDVFIELFDPNPPL